MQTDSHQYNNSKTVNYQTADMPRAGTILDYLNEDCWIVLLGYIPLQDIIKSESTSRQWQRRVLNYLSNIRVGVMMYDGDVEYTRNKKWGIVANMSNVRWVRLKEECVLSFESWTKKLGTSVVGCSVNNIHILGKNCPNLEGVEFLNVTGELLLENKYENYSRLKHLCFCATAIMLDDYLDHLIRSPVLEDLSILVDHSLTGQCFANITSKNLKTLYLQYCKLSIRYLAAASHHFKELRELAVNEICDEDDPDAKNILLVLEKTVKLERLFMFGFGKLVDGSFEAVCRLRCLKELKIDVPGSDEALEAVTRRCPELQILKFQECRAVTGRGVAAMCANAGARLTELKLPHNNLTDDDVVACIKACPNLKVFNLPFSQRLTPAVVARAAACRELCRCDLFPNNENDIAIDALYVLERPLPGFLNVKWMMETRCDVSKI